VDVLEDVAEFAGRDVRELLSFAVEMLVDFHGSFLEHAVGFLRATCQKKVWPARDSLQAILGIERQAQQGRAFILVFGSARVHRVEICKR
jgi:hypothetical protein